MFFIVWGGGAGCEHPSTPAAPPSPSPTSIPTHILHPPPHLPRLSSPCGVAAVAATAAAFCCILRPLHRHQWEHYGLAGADVPGVGLSQAVRLTGLSVTGQWVTGRAEPACLTGHPFPKNEPSSPPPSPPPPPPPPTAPPSLPPRH